MPRKGGVPENLRTRRLTTEEARELQKKSAASRNKRKQGRERVLALFHQLIPDDPKWASVKQMLDASGIDPESQDYEIAMHCALVHKVLLEGDAKAYKELMNVAQLTRDTVAIEADEPIVIKFGDR